MGWFLAGFAACAAVSVLFPGPFKTLHDAAARAIRWLRGLPSQGPAE